MSIERTNLRKLLQLLYADRRLQRSLLLKDIRNDRRKEAGDGDGGGDFYGPFWADVKAHAVGSFDIRERTALRITANKGRARLYPVLTECFLALWTERMRWRNEPFEFVPESIKARWTLKELEVVVKIENTVAVRVWDGSHRVIYPYFSEEPALPEEGVRFGFWALKQALPNFRAEEFRIVDMQHRAYFRPGDVVMKGNEGELFVQKYRALLQEWNPLRI